MNAAELMVRCFEAEGVRYVFGVPGEENAEFMLALEDSSLRFVLTRHEQGAAFMADVHGRLTGEAAVCLGTLGPGATNLVTGVANGNMDRSPMIVLTGQADVTRQHKESHQAMDVVGLFKPVTKWATPVIHPGNIPEVVSKAVKLAEMEKPGACHIELADDLAGRLVEGVPIPAPPPRRPVPDDKIVDRAWEAIRRARRPVILAGNGTIRKRASRQLRIFAEKTGAGVISTFMGKGSISRHSEQCLFSIGLQSRDMVACAVDAADLVITLGYDLVEYPPEFWNGGADKKIVHVDFLPAEVDAHYNVAVEVVGDLAHSLWMLNERVERDPVRFESEGYARIREEMLADFAEHAGDTTARSIRPQKAIWDVRRALGPSDILLCDVGAHKMWVGRYYHCDEPNTCLMSNGFCSMGFALPGAIAAKLVHPDRRVLALCGDAGFLMNVQELETAKRLGTNIVALIWEDHDYGLISWMQRTRFGKNVNMTFGNPDFVRLAESFGCLGLRVENAAELEGALRQAFEADRPAVVTIPIDYRENDLLTDRLGGISCPI